MNKNNEQGVDDEAVKKPIDWRRNVKRAGSVSASSAISAACR